MTNTKKIRLLSQYIEKGLGEQVVLILKDRWDFDPEVFPRKYNIREQFTVNDSLEQYTKEEGYVYQGLIFKELQKIIEKNTPKTVICEYKDTREKFFEEHPNFLEEERIRLNKLIGRRINSYKSQFI